MICQPFHNFYVGRLELNMLRSENANFFSWTVSTGTKIHFIQKEFASTLLKMLLFLDQVLYLSYLHEMKDSDFDICNIIIVLQLCYFH